MLKRFMILAAVALATACAQAQIQTPSPIAITEVQSAELLSGYGDWWEIKNFGTNDIDLTGYSWNDDSHGGLSIPPGADAAPFSGTTIHAGEVIVFAEPGSVITSAAAFRTWWGLASGVNVIMLPSSDPGLGAGGDTVRIWNTNGLINGAQLGDGGQFLVDRADLFAVQKGVTLQYNPTNGLYNITNSIGKFGAFKAATTADVGSPGFAPTNSPVVIATNPVSTSTVAGLVVSFKAYAYGQPRPVIQWRFNGTNLDPSTINGTINSTVSNNYTFSTLTFTNVDASNAGNYVAVATNYFQSVSSTNAALIVFTNAVAPFFTSTPATTNLFAYPGQSVVFSAVAYGNPNPTFQWQHDGVNLSGANTGTYSLSVNDTNGLGIFPDDGLYTLVVSNSQGVTNVSVLLNVTSKPNLHITEVCVTESTNTTTKTHGDWWELSNLGNFAVNLRNYRFDDNSFSLAQAYTFTNDVIIAAGETIVLVEDETPEQFRAWWGETNLPVTLQIIPYHWSALSFSATSGDSLELWNPAATAESDYIDFVSMSATTNFPTSFATYNIDPYNLNFSGIAPQGFSVAGVNGAFAASDGGDIGSPGTFYILPRFTSISHTGAGVSLNWNSQSNFVYDVQVSTNLGTSNWITVGQVTASNSVTASYIDPTNRPVAYYRLNLHR